jgi:hypothetical protein
MAHRVGDCFRIAIALAETHIILLHRRQTDLPERMSHHLHHPLVHRRPQEVVVEAAAPEVAAVEAAAVVVVVLTDRRGINFY